MVGRASPKKILGIIAAVYLQSKRPSHGQTDTVHHSTKYTECIKQIQVLQKSHGFSCGLTCQTKTPKVAI